MRKDEFLIMEYKKNIKIFFYCLLKMEAGNV